MGSAVRADDLVLDDFRPTHVVPRYGMPAWETPGSARPTVPLDPFLPVQLLERTGDWARVLCSNGWSAWVDGRLLVSVPDDPPAAARDMARAADPRPLLAHAEASLGRYRAAAEDLAEGRTDGEGFRGSTAGLRLGVVVEGEAMWLYDAEHERWLYCDGRRLAEYATSSTPSAHPPPSHGATRATPPGTSGGPGSSGGGPGSSGGPGAAAGHEPTRVVPVRPDDARPAPSDGAAPDAPPVHEPTRVVRAPGADAGSGPGIGPGADTGAGADAGSGERGSAGAGASEGAPRPGRPPDAEPTRVVDLPDTGTDAGLGSAGREGAGDG
ncbi:hypothetical protein [Streptomyces sp. enrichment culture]|uniref:hypothetical protein n=1 Tax=Streptomyces sp. enrichment culture TaxID=1795815 RepID=UPI003F568C36